MKDVFNKRQRFHCENIALGLFSSLGTALFAAGAQSASADEEKQPLNLQEQQLQKQYNLLQQSQVKQKHQLLPQSMVREHLH